MRFVWIFTIPLGLIVLLVGGAPSMLNVKPRYNPETIILNNEADYHSKAEIYAQRGRRQEALDTCTEMIGKFSESDHERCLMNVYDILNDIDGEIAVYEKALERELANGDRGGLTRYVLEGLKEKRDKRK